MVKAMYYRINRKSYICGSYTKYGKKAYSSHVIEKILLDDIKEMANGLEYPDL